GHDPRSDLVTGQVDTDADGYVRVAHPSTRTNLAGVFAAGDLVDHTYRQAITAAGTGCAAAQDAQHYLSNLAPATVSAPVLEVSAGAPSPPSPPRRSGPRCSTPSCPSWSTSGRPGAGRARRSPRSWTSSPVSTRAG